MLRRLLTSILVLALLGVVASCSEDKKDTAVQSEQASVPPIIDKLAIDSYGESFITLAKPLMSPSGPPADSIVAYIGLNGSIRYDGAQIVESLQGPVDVSAKGCTFWKLKPDESYRIIVVAKKDSASAVRYINPVRAEFEEISADDYPGMDEKELGHLRWAFKLADSELDDFSMIKSINLYGIPVTGKLNLAICSYRYSLAFTTYFLALEQYHKMPACLDVIKPKFDRIIQKMLQKQVWEYWALESRGIPLLEPNLDFPYPLEHDPVKYRNIMYSGHLAQMMALYEKLYGDMKWSSKGSIVFKWSDKEKYVYDHNTLQKQIYDQFINLPEHCIECEPNACFAICNQHPILAHMVYDQVHGTNYYDVASPLLFAWFLRTKQISPIDHETAAAYLVKQKKILAGNELDLGNPLSSITILIGKLNVLSVNSAAVDGWNGTFMNAWRPDLISYHYPFQKQNRLDSKGLIRKDDRMVDQLSAAFFAMLAAEMGDDQARKTLVEWTDRQYEPEFGKDGVLNYELSPMDVPFSISPHTSKYANSTTIPLVAIARANMKDGMRDLHANPFDGSYTSYPKVKNVDFNTMSLFRAIYDKNRDCLVITTGKGPTAAKTSRITFENLDPKRTWSLKINGIEKERFENTSTINIDVPLDGKKNIVLAAE